MEEQRRSRGGRSGGASRRAGRGLASRMQLEVPALPDRVLSAHDAGVVLSAHDTQQYQQQAQQSLSQSVSQLYQQQELDAGGSSQSVSQLPSLKDREESFFKDLYRNPNLQNGHPLSHLIASQSKLEQVAIGSPGAGAGSKSRRRGGRKGGSGAAGPSPYNVVQKVVVNEGAAARRRNRKARRNQPPLPTFKDYSAFGLEGEGEGEGEQGGGTKTAGGKGRTAGKGKGRGKGGPQQQPGDMAVSESAAKHREFLLNTLQDVQQQLDNPPPLLEEPAAPSASAGGGGAAAELSSLSAPAPYATEKSAGASDSSGERSGGVGAGSSSMSQASGPESELKVRLGHTVSGESCTVAFTGRFDSGAGELEAVVTHVPSGNRAEVLGLALPVAAKDAGTFKDYCGKTLEKLQISVGADGSLDASFRG